MSISGRLVLLTIFYVVIIELALLIFGAAVFRNQLLRERVFDASLAARAILTNPTPNIDSQQANALLQDAKILDLAIKRQNRRERLLAPAEQYKVDSRIDIDNVAYTQLIAESLICVINANDKILLVTGSVNNELENIETLVSNRTLCQEQREASLVAIPFAIAVSLFLGALVYFTARNMLVRPIEFFAKAAKGFDAQNGTHRMVEVRSKIKEIRQTQSAMKNMQLRVLNSFKERSRLATIGESVAKIQHDLRNMLSTAQMVADNLETSSDPRVKRSAPRLVRAIDRAVELSTQTLEYGKLGDKTAQIETVALYELISEVVENEILKRKDDSISIKLKCSQTITCKADPKSMRRIIENIIRNARQILEQEDNGGNIQISVVQNEKVHILIEDDGPGFSDQARTYLFQPFKGSTRAGGTGLGLAICKELCEIMGGDLDLDKSDLSGTRFKIEI